SRWSGVARPRSVHASDARCRMLVALTRCTVSSRAAAWAFHWSKFEVIAGEPRGFVAPSSWCIVPGTAGKRMGGRPRLTARHAAGTQDETQPKHRSAKSLTKLALFIGV